MLVVSRRVDQVLTIGPEIEVMVVRIGKDAVRLGIKAPKDLAVHRKEVPMTRRRQSGGAATRH